MAKSYSTLRERLSPRAQAYSRAKTEAMLHDTHLQELREARQMTQEEVAKQLQVKQSSVSKLERQADMYISTLRNYLSAIGGELEIKAKFPDGEVNIAQFEDLV